MDMHEDLFVHAEEAAFLKCKTARYTIASSDGGFIDDLWARYLEEREWMSSAAYRREGEDCPKGTRGPAVYDFETPVYHLLSLARDGIDVAVEAAELTEEAHKNALKASIHIVNADGSVDDDCAPLTMTIKARIYSLSAPRSMEIRHEYHRRHGYDYQEYHQRVSWRLNHTSECGRRFMPAYKRDEGGWHTMFTVQLEHSRGATHSRNMGPTSAGTMPRRRGGKGARGRGRGRRRPREEELVDACDTDGTETCDSKGGEVAGDEADNQYSQTPQGTPATDGDSSGGTGNVGSSNAIGMQPAPAPRVLNSHLKQKWLMTSEDLDAIRDHLMAGTPLEDDLSGYDLLELLLASVGVSAGKVGEVEVGKPLYGRPFLEHFKRRIGGASGAAARAGAGSQAVSEESEPEETENTRPKRSRHASVEPSAHMSGSVQTVNTHMNPGMGMNGHVMPPRYPPFMQQTMHGALPGPQVQHHHAPLSRLGQPEPYHQSYLPMQHQSFPQGIVHGYTLMMPNLQPGMPGKNSRDATPTGSIGSWPGNNGKPVGNMQGTVVAAPLEPERSNGGSSRRKRGRNSSSGGRSSLPPLGVPSGIVMGQPMPANVRPQQHEVEAS